LRFIGARIRIFRESRSVTVAPRGSILRQHDFRLLWIGETVSKCGSAATVLALPLVAVVNLHAGTFTIGVLEACAWLPWLLVSLPAGAWVDGFARRPVMQLCNVGSAALFLSVPFAAWSGRLTIAHLLVVAFGAGVAKVFLRTAYQAYLPSVVGRDRLPEANAMMQGSASAADVAGPGLAGVMAQAFGAVTAVLADGLTFLVSAACLARIRAREVPPEDPRRTAGLLGRIAAGLRYVFGDPYLRVLALFGASGNFLLVAVQTLLVVFLVRVVGVAPGVAGLLLAGMGVGGVLGAVVIGPVIRRLGSARALLWCEAGTAPFGLLLPTAAPGMRLTLFAVGAIVLTAGIVAGSVIGGSFRQAYCPPHLLGRVSAVVSFLVYGVMPIGALAGGALGAVLGVRGALWLLCAALILPVGLLVFSPISGRRDLPTQPGASASATAAT
jgi:predicted MFS family arabinose efflux permease